MRLLWISWKDRQNPLAGGAEIVTDQLLKRLAAEGNDVTLLTAGFVGSKTEERYNGYQIQRLGNRLTVYRQVRQFLKNQKPTYDVVIEEINTVPFFAQRFVKTPKYFLFFHQLARKIWWYEAPFPVSLLGYLLEPAYLRRLASRSVITVSPSTKRDLIRYGFNPQKIKIISEGILLEPVKDLKAIQKYPQPTILSFGALRSMKRTLDQVKSFELIKQKIPTAQLIIAGPTHSAYAQKVQKYIARSRYRSAITILGSVSEAKKLELMQRSHIIQVTSVKEGWGLIVTDANSQGTPAIAYDVDGLRDSIRNGETGLIISPNKPKILAKAVIGLLGNKDLYEKLRFAGWELSKNITFKRSYSDLLAILNDGTCA